MPAEKTLDELVTEDKVIAYYNARIAEFEALKTRRKIKLMRQTKVGRQVDGPWKARYAAKVADAKRLLLEISQHAQLRARLEHKVEQFQEAAKRKPTTPEPKQLHENLDEQNGRVQSPNSDLVGEDEQHLPPDGIIGGGEAIREGERSPGT